MIFLYKEEEYKEDVTYYYDCNYVLLPTPYGVLYATAYDSITYFGEKFAMQDDVYQGQACISYKVKAHVQSPLLLSPEDGITFADSCSGWRKYTSKAYYCHSGLVYKVYQVGTTVVGHEIAVAE